MTDTDPAVALKRAQLADLRAAHPTPSPFVQAIIDRLSEELDPTPAPVTFSEEDVGHLYARIRELEAELAAEKAKAAASAQEVQAKQDEAEAIAKAAAFLAG